MHFDRSSVPLPTTSTFAICKCTIYLIRLHTCDHLCTHAPPHMQRSCHVCQGACWRPIRWMIHQPRRHVDEWRCIESGPPHNLPTAWQRSSNDEIHWCPALVLGHHRLKPTIPYKLQPRHDTPQQLFVQHLVPRSHLIGAPRHVFGSLEVFLPLHVQAP